MRMNKKNRGWRIWIFLFFSLIFYSHSVNGNTTDGKETVTLTMPLFFENRIPDDISKLEDAADRRVYEKIGVNVKLVPMLRTAKMDTRRSTEMLMMQREGVCFDLVHASMPDIEFLELTNFLRNDGEGILELFEKNGQNLLEEQQIFAIPSFSDYVEGQGIAMRKDIIEKYDIDLSQLHTYDDFDRLFSRIASLEPEMKMICSYSTSRGLLYRSIWNDFEDTIFCVSSEDDSVVVNRYDTSEYEHLVQLFHSWYEKGYLYEYAPLQDIAAFELVRAGVLFSFVCAYKPGIDTETSKSCGMEMIVVQTAPHVITERSLSRGCWGISADCSHPKEAMQLLNLLYTDRELANILVNGTEEMQKEEFLNDAAWILPNQFLTDISDSDDPLLWEKVDEYNRSAANAPNLHFIFDDSKVKRENETLNKIAEEYEYGLETGQLDPDIYLDEMLKKMEQAGEKNVYQELCRQYQSWRDTKGEG